jgi:hypothetical protein
MKELQWKLLKEVHYFFFLIFLKREKGKLLKNGNFFEIQFDQVYSGAGKDSVLFDSKTASNQIVSLDSATIPPVYYKIFSECSESLLYLRARNFCKWRKTCSCLLHYYYYIFFSFLL